MDRREKIGSRQRKDKVKVSCREVQTLKVQNGIRMGMLNALYTCIPLGMYFKILCFYFARGHHCLDFVGIFYASRTCFVFFEFFHIFVCCLSNIQLCPLYKSVEPC